MFQTWELVFEQNWSRVIYLISVPYLCSHFIMCQLNAPSLSCQIPSSGAAAPVGLLPLASGEQPWTNLVLFWLCDALALMPQLVSTRSDSASKYPRCSCFASSCFKVAEEESKFSSACIQKHQHQLNENCGAEQPSRPGKNNASRLTFRSNQDLKSSFTLYRWNPLCCLPWCSRIRAFFF